MNIQKTHGLIWTWIVSVFLLAVGPVWAEEAPKPFSLQVEVEPSQVILTVFNRGPDAVIRENLVVERWDEASKSWKFAANPLWVCATKETVFAASIASGKYAAIAWNKSLHKGCAKAGSGRYRALVKDNQGIMQSLPVEFEIKAVVEKERNQEYRETRYRIRQGECVLTWEMRDTAPGVSLQRSTCSLSLQDQAPLLSSLLEAVIQSETLPKSGWSLYWGRLGPSTTHCFELSKRLMLAAHQSKDWDAKRGKPKKGHENNFVLQILEQSQIYPELKEIFQAQGLGIKVSDVEKVLVFKAKDLPCYSELKLLGISPEEKLPFDCQTWFKVFPQKALP